MSEFSRGGRGSGAYSATAARDEEEDGVFIANNSVGSMSGSTRSAGIRGNFSAPSLPVSQSRRRGWWPSNYSLSAYFRPSYWNASSNTNEGVEYDTTFRRYKKRRQRIMFVLAAFLITVVVLAVVITGGEEIVKHVSANNIVSHGSYKVVQKAAIPDIQADMVVYEHKQTHAQVLTIIPNDQSQDTVFGASIKTLAEDNGGSPHVLMHALWDGSDKYPLKDPVHEYHKGSLTTHLSAQCLEDRTVYTAATRNRADFKNLMSILLDSLYMPNFMKKQHQEWIFREEGWRLDPKDGATFTTDNPDLEFNGVTLNLQKAVYVDPDEMMERFARRALYPDTRYQFDAQGVPDEMFNLRIRDVEGFYKKHYAATNSQIFFYGPVDHVSDGLEAFDTYVHKHNPRLDKLRVSMAQWQPLNMAAPAEEIHAYPISVDAAGGYQIMTSWLVNHEMLDLKTEFAWQMIEYLLLGTPTSVIRKGLTDELTLKEEAYINGTVIPSEVVGGLDTKYQQWRFSIGIKGVPNDRVSALQGSIIARLAAIKSFEPAALEAAFNVVELSRRDLSSGRVPRGVALFHKILSHWSYMREPQVSLEFGAGLDALRQELDKNGDKMLVDMIQTMLVKNMHRVDVSLFGRQFEVTKQEKAESDRLKLMRETLSDQDFNEILQQSVKLAGITSSPIPPDVYDLLPHLEITEVAVLNQKRTAHLSINHKVLSAQTAVESSFGLLFVDFGLELQGVPFGDVSALPLVFQLMLEAGTQKYSAEELSNQMGAVSTGIKAEYMLLDVRQRDYSGPLQFSVHDGIHLATKVFFRGRCKAEKLGDYLDLLSEVVFHGRTFTKDEVVATLSRMIEELEKKVDEQGHEIARRRLDARYSYQGIIDEVLNGFNQLMFLHNALVIAVIEWPKLEEQLSRIHKALMAGNRNGMVMSVTGEQSLLEHAKTTVDQFLDKKVPENKDDPFPGPGEKPHPWVPGIQSMKNNIAPFTDEALIVPTEVDYVGKAGKLFEAGTAVDGSAAVVAKYVEQVYLYRELREKRGAGNVFAEFNFRHGTFTLLSDRDPHLSETLTVFDGAASVLSAAIVDRHRLPVGAHQAIVGTIADWDGTAKQPDEIGWDFVAAYYRDDNADFEQNWRNQMLNTTRHDFVNFVNAFLQWKSPSVAIVSNAERYLKLKHENKDQIGLHAVCMHFYCPGISADDK